MRFDIFAKRDKPRRMSFITNLRPELRVQICGIVDETVVAAGYSDYILNDIGRSMS